MKYFQIQCRFPRVLRLTKRGKTKLIVFPAQYHMYIGAFVFVAWRMMRHIITDRSKEAILWKSITQALLLLVDMFLYMVVDGDKVGDDK